MELDVAIGEIMNRDVKTVSPEDDIETAALLMKNEDIGSVIVEKDGNVQGIVTATDIVRRYVASTGSKTVGDIMTAPITATGPDTTIEQAARVMTEKGIERLAVIEENELIGIVSATDILRVEPKLFEILRERIAATEPEAGR